MIRQLIKWLYKGIAEEEGLWYDDGTQLIRSVLFRLPSVTQEGQFRVDKITYQALEDVPYD